MVNGLNGLREWYQNDVGAGRVTKFMKIHQWGSVLDEIRTPWQIDKVEMFRLSVPLMGVTGFVIGSMNGYSKGLTKFEEIKAMELYEHRERAVRTGKSWITLAMMGYGIPMALRCVLYSSTLLAVPTLLGVYRGDQDYVSHYVGAGALTGVFMGYRAGIKGQILTACTVSLCIGLPVGLIFWFQQSEYNTADKLPNYTARKKRMEDNESYIIYKQNMRIEMEKKREREMNNDQVTDIVQSKTISAATDIVPKESEKT